MVDGEVGLPVTAMGSALRSSGRMLLLADWLHYTMIIKHDTTSTSGGGVNANNAGFSAVKWNVSEK